MTQLILSWVNTELIDSSGRLPRFYKASIPACYHRGTKSIDSDKLGSDFTDKEGQLNRISGQLEKLSKLSDEELKEKVESLEKHRKRST